MKREIALNIIEGMRQNYNLIAREFSQTRRSSWEEIKPLVSYAHTGDKILDLGCGNGRLVEMFKGKAVEYVGLDNSEKLIEAAKEKHPIQDFRVYNGFNIPFADNYFDIIYCVAVLHHIPSNQLRREFMEDAIRVLRPGGKMILTVWYFWQKKSYWQLFFKFTLKKLIGKSEMDFFDIKQPWFIKAERYFHLFRKNELIRLFEKTGFKIEQLNIFNRGPENKNFLVIAVKKN